MIRCILPALLAAGCVIDLPVTEDNVITVLSIQPGPTGERAADGTSALLVQLCVVDQLGRDPTLTGTLRASAGRWVASDASDGLSIAVPLTRTCEHRMIVPTTDVGPLTVMATVAGFQRSATEALVAARIDRVRLGVVGLLSATDPSMLTVTATLDVLPAGGIAAPSKGTDVELQAGIEPPGAVGHLADAMLTVTTGDTVTTTFFATPAVTRVTFRAIARAMNRAPLASDPLAIDR